MYTLRFISRNTNPKLVTLNWDLKKSHVIFQTWAKKLCAILMSVELSASVRKSVLVTFWLVRLLRRV
ncbi:hypothetical protein D3C78_840730 [compost metagenome]